MGIITRANVCRSTGEDGGPVAWGDVSGKPASFPPADHSHTVANVTGLQAALDGKQAAGDYAASSHTHSIGNVTGLQSALDGKQASGSYASASHTHTVANVDGLQAIIDDLTSRLEALEAA